MFVHVVPPSVLMYARVLVDEPSVRRYSEPLAADTDGAPEPT
jgi:hypothetical protein